MLGLVWVALPYVGVSTLVRSAQTWPGEVYQIDDAAIVRTWSDAPFPADAPRLPDSSPERPTVSIHLADERTSVEARSAVLGALETLLGEKAAGSRTYLDEEVGTLRLWRADGDVIPRLELTINDIEITPDRITTVLDALWTATADVGKLGLQASVVYDLRAGSKRPPMALGKQLISWLGDQTPEGDRGEIVSAVFLGVAVLLPDSFLGRTVQKTVNLMVKAAQPSMQVQVWAAGPGRLQSLEDWVQTNEDTALRAAATHPREEPEVLAAADWEPRGTLIAAS
jgi:hypothetical protein